MKGATRLAPSPTGALHLGNARSFLLNWLIARAEGRRLLLRIEDLESPRKAARHLSGMLRDLEWLGLDWDEQLPLQSQRAEHHSALLERWIEEERIYACICTRRDVAAAQDAPHAGEELRYPGTCRDLGLSPAEAFARREAPVALRWRVPDSEIHSFGDRMAGPCRVAHDAGGDFVVARYAPESGFVIGYQLAVAVDDAEQGIALVVRGADLLPSTARQALVRGALGAPEPEHAHLPLVVGADGRRLAKRHGDTRVAAYREAGVSADRVRAWVAQSAHLPVEVWEAPGALGPEFPYSRLPREQVRVPAHAVPAGPPLGAAD